jgi:hypothetical protein
MTYRPFATPLTALPADTATQATARPIRQPGTRPRRPALPGLLLAAGLLAQGAAHAVPVSVSVGGLPPGLSPVLTVKRNTCPDGMGWIASGQHTLTESSFTTLERITLPSGLTTMRSRIITRYVASFDAPPTTDRPGPLPEVRCSRVSLAPDLFAFDVHVFGTGGLGLPAVLSGSLGQQSQQQATVVVNPTLAARTTELAVVNQPQDTLARGMVHSVHVGTEASLGTVQSRSLALLRPSTLFPGAFSTAARLFERNDGVACIQAGKVTQCLGETVSPEAGGVYLRGLLRPRAGQPGPVTFQFELQQGFAVGPLKLSASADATDLTRYLVDGQLQALDLLPWQAQSKLLTVQ